MNSQNTSFRGRRPLFWGSLLITLGVGFLLERYGIYDFDSIYISSLIAILLIIIGVGFLSIPNVAKQTMTVLSGILIAVFMLSVGFSVKPIERVTKSFSHYEKKIRQSKSLYYNYLGDSSSIMIRSLENCDLTIMSISTHSLQYVSRIFIPYILERTSPDSVSNMSFSLYPDVGPLDDDRELSGRLQLNDSTVWAINFSSEDGKLDANLSKFRLSNVHFDIGEADARIILGNKPQRGDILLESNDADINLTIPNSSYCELITNSCSRNEACMIPPEFIKKSPGFYVAGDSTTAKSRYFITISGTYSRLQVNSIPQ